MNETTTLPDVTLQAEIFTASDLAKATRQYEREHNTIPNALVTGYMERRSNQELIYCNSCYIADASGKWFTVCHPMGTYTVRVPEHESITVVLTVDSE